MLPTVCLLYCYFILFVSSICHILSAVLAFFLAGLHTFIHLITTRCSFFTSFFTVCRLCLFFSGVLAARSNILPFHCLFFFFLLLFYSNTPYSQHHRTPTTSTPIPTIYQVPHNTYNRRSERLGPWQKDPGNATSRPNSQPKGWHSRHLVAILFLGLLTARLWLVITVFSCYCDFFIFFFF